MNSVPQVTVMVEDSDNTTIPETFIVTVLPVSFPPFLVRINSAVVNAGHEIGIQISPVLGIIFYDLDDDILTIKIMQEDGSDLPTWITIADDLFTATPTIADAGSYTFVIAATDATGVTSSNKFML